MTEIERLVRPHLLGLKPYSSARDEYSGTEGVFLDANENPFDDANHPGINRYPDPHQAALKNRLAEIKGVPADQIFIGNGSDEVIDLLIRAFCEPGKDSIIILPPTYGMYEVSATINNVGIHSIPMLPGFQPDVERILNECRESDKILFLCSPNNPSANLLDADKIQQLIDGFKGIVVLDEAYIDFAPEGSSFVRKVMQHPRLVISQTLSKAWGMAGLRLGIAIAQPEMIRLLDKIKPPYNVNLLSQQVALKKLNEEAAFDAQKEEILRERDRVMKELKGISGVEIVFPSDANFVLARIKNAKWVYQKMLEKFIILRDRSKFVLCEDAIRITIGTREENDAMLRGLTDLKL
jgi:histidinol-phosphate aminotransferase